jgi:hypothetical protein
MITRDDVVLRGGFKAETSLPAVDDGDDDDDDGGENTQIPQRCLRGRAALPVLCENCLAITCLDFAQVWR